MRKRCFHKSVKVFNSEDESNRLNQLFYTMIVIARSLRRRRTDILYVGESSLDVGEQKVGETTGYQESSLQLQPDFAFCACTH